MVYGSDEEASMKRNRDVEVLRALAIMYMLIYHYGMSITGISKTDTSTILIESFGQFALIGFFILSGFGSYCSFSRQESNGTILYGSYIKRRLKAVIPLYYFWMVLALLFTSTVGFLSRENFKYVIEAFLLVQNFDFNNEINGVTWTLAVLTQLYFIAFPVYIVVKRYGIKSVGIIFIIVIL